MRAFATMKTCIGRDVPILSEVSGIPETDIMRLIASNGNGGCLASEELFAVWTGNGRSPVAESMIYGDPRYVVEAWVCYFEWARTVTRRLSRAVDEGIISIRGGETVCDLGAGAGLSTIDLLKIAPRSRVVYHNAASATYQNRLFSRLSEGVEGSERIVRAIGEIPDADIYIASEFFEHIREPGSLLKAILEKDPRMFVHSTSFSAPNAPGHFLEYKFDGVNVPGKKAMKRFNAILREAGYAKVVSKIFWNARPSVWVKR